MNTVKELVMLLALGEVPGTQVVRNVSDYWGQARASA